MVCVSGRLHILLTFPKGCLNMCLSVRTWSSPCLSISANVSFALNPLICFLLLPVGAPPPPSLISGPGGDRPETLTHLFLYPGTVAGRRHGQLDEAGAQEHQQQDGRDVLPHVVIEAVRREAQHVLQVFKEPERAAAAKQWEVRSQVCANESKTVSSL